MCKENLYPVDCVVVKYLSENFSSPSGKWYFHMVYADPDTRATGSREKAFQGRKHSNPCIKY